LVLAADHHVLDPGLHPPALPRRSELRAHGDDHGRQRSACRSSGRRRAGPELGWRSAGIGRRAPLRRACSHDQRRAQPSLLGNGRGIAWLNYLSDQVAGFARRPRARHAPGLALHPQRPPRQRDRRAARPGHHRHRQLQRPGLRAVPPPRLPVSRPAWPTWPTSASGASTGLPTTARSTQRGIVSVQSCTTATQTRTRR
jgi:hypothetical protein